MRKEGVHNEFICSDDKTEPTDEGNKEEDTLSKNKRRDPRCSSGKDRTNNRNGGKWHYLITICAAQI